MLHLYPALLHDDTAIQSILLEGDGEWDRMSKNSITSSGIYWQSYACLKRCVFKSLLNCSKSTLSIFLKSSGRLFHSFGAATRKLRSPKFFNLDLGSLRRFLEVERRERGGTYHSSKSERWDEARPF